MTADFIIKTDHGELRLTTDGKLPRGEWDTLSASLQALEPIVVASELPMSPEEAEAQIERLAGLGGSERVIDWSAPTKDNNDSFRGPLDISVMGLRLHDGDVAVVTRSHQDAHVGTMHRWIRHPNMPGDNYGCGHGGCNASVTVTKDPF